MQIFGRLTTRLCTADIACLQTDLPVATLPLPETLFDPARCFPFDAQDIWLEIGFGSGEYLLEQARRHPKVGFIGCEPFVKGACQLIRATQAHGLANVRVFMHHARLLLEKIKPRTIGRLYALFPDPWPKKRHHKRRLLTTQMLTVCARALKKEGVFIIASDSVSLIEWIKSQALACSLLRLVHAGMEPPADWVPTKYYKKAQRHGHEAIFLTFGKIDG